MSLPYFRPSSRKLRAFAVRISVLVAGLFLAAPGWAGPDNEPPVDATCARLLAKNGVEDSPAFAELVTPASSSGSVFVGRFRRGLGERFRNYPEVLALTKELAASSAQGDARIHIRWDDTTGVIRKAFEDDRLRFTLEKIAVVEGKSETDAGREVEIGRRVRRPNTSFARVLTAITEALRLEILQRPRLQIVEIRAGVVMNPSLLESLQKMGFQFVPNLKFNTQTHYQGDMPSFPPMNRFLSPPMMAMQKPEMLSLGMDMAVTLGSIEQSSDLGRTLYLTFHVNRPLN